MMMLMRLVHLIVVAALVVAAVGVYTIKFESTVRAEHVAKLAAEIKHERDTIATLRAEWALLDNPARIEALVHRHLALKMLDPAQIEHLTNLPERPPMPAGPPEDAIATILDALEGERPPGATPSAAPPTAGAPR
jgi:hypothetical protein